MGRKGAQQAECRGLPMRHAARRPAFDPRPPNRT